MFACRLRTTTSLARRELTRRTTFTMPGGPKGMPVPQSNAAKLFEGHPQREGWEWTIAWWYTSSVIIFVAAQYLPPETNIQVWAHEEALARLKLKEEHGFTDFKFGVHYKDLELEQSKEGWDKFSQKALVMNDDDDDDDDEDEEDDDDDDEE